MKERAVAKAFGRVLRKNRKARGMSQEDLAGEADVDRTYPSLLENGHRDPTLGVFFQLCKALRRSPADLVTATLQELASVQPLHAALKIGLAPVAAPPTLQTTAVQPPQRLPAPASETLPP